eukprot:4784098-Prymnesium_polylepis.1
MTQVCGIRPGGARDVAVVKVVRVIERLYDGLVSRHVVSVLNVLAETRVILVAAFRQVLGPRIPRESTA